MPKKLTPIAVIGVGAMYPGSTSAAGFWSDIVNSKDRITDVPRTHWLAEDYVHPEPVTPDKIPSARGGFLSPVDFSPLDFGLVPNAVEATDTSQLLALLVARQVLEDAARGPFERLDRSRTGVVLGVASATELVAHMSGRLQLPVWERAMRRAGLAEDEIERVSGELAECYVPWQENTFPGLLGNVVAGRVASRFDLGGTNCVVDAACASSLAALEIAVNQLQLGQADLMISGGVDTLNDILMYMCFAQTGALSPNGQCRPFSSFADGTILGEGLGMVALKRLEDAERDGDAVYAVLRGLGSSSDGRAKSIYAPRPEGQASCLRRAYESAGYSAATVELLEAHGTGTVAGDAAELRSMRMVFDEAGARQKSCALGSVKSQIGHTKAAAGAAGLLKAIFALHHQVLPPTIGVEAPNPTDDLIDSPFYLNTEARPWIRDGAHPRRAGVSSFGFGGTNFHVTLEEYSGEAPRPLRFRTAASEVIALSAATKAELLEKLGTLGADERQLEVIARQSQEKFEARASVRLSFVVGTEAGALPAKLTQAQALVEKAEADQSTPTGIFFSMSPPQEGRVAVLFPGQGSQYPNMGRAEALVFPEVVESWGRAASALGSPGQQLHDLVFPAPEFGEGALSRADEALRATEWTQPALCLTGMNHLNLLRRAGVQVDCFAGHSVGELTALSAASEMSVEETVRLARARADAMNQVSSEESGMLAVRAAPGRLTEFLSDGVVVANHNGPEQVVLSGKTSALEETESRLKAAGLTFKRLNVAKAFHSPEVEGAVGAFERALAEANFRPSADVYSNVTAEKYSAAPEKIRTQLASALAHPVRFVDQIEQMYEDGVRTFIEAGPHSVLSGMVRAILGDRPHLAVSLDRKGRDGVTSLHAALAELLSRGMDLKLQELGAELIRPHVSRDQPKFALQLGGANFNKPMKHGGLPSSAQTNEPAPRPQNESMTAQEKPAEPIPSPLPQPAAPAQSSPVAAPPPIAPQAIPGQGVSNSALEVQMAAIQAQREFQRVMAESHQAFLALMGGGVPAAPTVSTPAPQPPSYQPAIAPVAAPVAQPMPAAPPVAAPQPVPAAPPSPVAPAAAPTSASPAPGDNSGSESQEDILDVMLSVVAEKTGYPADMLNAEMNIEADLGIDSIKRVEILSAVRQAVPGLPEVDAAKVGAMQTLGEVAGALGANPSASPAPSGAEGGADILQTMLQVVAEKTGYPADMLNAEMNIEADLGIDSIKRVEILSAVRQAVPGLPEVDAAKVGAMQTLGEVAAALGASGKAEAPASSATARAVDAGASPLCQYVIEPQEALSSGFSCLFKGEPLTLIADQLGVADQLAELLSNSGYPATVSKEGGTSCLDLRALDTPSSEEEALSIQRAVFEGARSLGSSAKLFVTVQDTGGRFGHGLSHETKAWLGGVAALAKTAAIEWSDARVKAIDLETEGLSVDALAARLFEELTQGGSELEVGLSADGGRWTLVPTLHHALSKSAPQDEVFFVTGGAKGVTSDCLVELAAQGGARFALAGRSGLTSEEPGFESAATEAELKSLLVQKARELGAMPNPREIGKKTSQILSSREIRRTVARIQEAGSEAIYLQADVSDAEALGRALQTVRDKWGPITGLVHAAGIIQDAHIESKTDAQFDLVTKTKLTSLISLLRETKSDPLTRLCFFSSVAARKGNTGQCDYAMANETLNKIALCESARRPGATVVSLGWGPWDGGMVGSTLKAHFEKMGVGLIGLGEGAQTFTRSILDEQSGEFVVAKGASLDEKQSRRIRSVVELGQSGYPQLIDHQIRGKVVVPVVLVLEWFARKAESLLGRRDGWELSEFQALRGVSLSQFGEKNEALHIEASLVEDGSYVLTLLDEKDAPRYRARLLTSSNRALAASAKAETLSSSPWQGGELYSEKTLFHGPEFQALETIHGFGENSARASLSAEKQSSWPGPGFRTDALVLDGALQLALLWGLSKLGRPSLPARIGAFVPRLAPKDQKLECELLIVDRSSEHLVCQAVIKNPAGDVVAELHDVEMYTFPSE